jgi:hypothetical protein
MAAMAAATAPRFIGISRREVYDIRAGFASRNTQEAKTRPGRPGQRDKRVESARLADESVAVLAGVSDGVHASAHSDVVQLGQLTPHWRD